MTGTVVVGLAVAVLGVGAVALWRRRPYRVGVDERMDGPRRLLAASIAALGADRREWGLAMLAELDHLTARGERWRFALGCSGAALLLLPRRGAPGRATAIVVAASALACVALVGYALLRYPGVVTGASTWASIVLFVAVLGGYTVTSGVLLRGMGAGARHAVPIALAGSAVVASGWVALDLTASSGGSGYATLLLLGGLLASLSVGAVCARRSGARVGRRAAAFSAIVGGVLVFLVWAGIAVPTGGRPYDPGMIRDFHASGAPDLATYAVNDTIGSAMALLVLVPMLATVVGLLGVTVSARLFPRTAGAD